jgi:ribosomal-protein-alanine N-acetyltransferase
VSHPPILTTERLKLRPFEPRDIEELGEVFDDLEAMWDVLAIPGMPKLPREIAARRIDDSIQGWDGRDAGFWAITLRDDSLGEAGRIVGYCGFVNPDMAETASREDVVLEVGWGIHPAFQRRGLAREAMAPVLDYAFTNRECARLVAITDPENHASRSLTERLGFSFVTEIQAYGTVQLRYELTREAYVRPASHP